MSEEERYLTNRVIDQINWYDNKSIKYKKYETRLTILAFITASIIPFIAGLGSMFLTKNVQSIVLGLLGLIASVCTGVLGIKKFKEL